MFGPSVKSGFRVPPKRIVDIRAHAVHVRRVLMLPDGGFFPMEPLLERLGEWSITLDVVEDAEMPIGVEACCVPESAYIALSETTFRQAVRDDPRGRFTVIHEIGHLTLAHARAFHRDDGAPIKTFEDSEWQADTFAAEFLMPAHDIVRKGIFTPQLMELEYQVSGKAAATRVGKLAKERILK